MEKTTMGAKTFKRMSINLTEELERSVLDLRMQEKYVRCTYIEIVRVLMTEGAKVLGVSHHQQ